MARNSLIGLDIGKSSIVGVQVAGRPPGASLKAFHERSIPEGLVFEGEVVDSEALALEIKEFMKESKIKGKSVHLGVANQKVVVRNLDLPEMDEGELRGAIEFQAQDYIPIPIEEAQLDHVVLDHFVDEEGIPKQHVLLVAAQKDMILGYVDACRRAGLKIAGIDVSSFALVRALASQLPFVDQGSPASPGFGILNLSSTVSSLVVAVDSDPRFTRIVNFAFDSFIQLLAERQGIPADDALLLAERIGLPGPNQADTDNYNQVTIDEVQSSLAGLADQLVDELRKSLDYYHQGADSHVERLALTGRGALVRNLDVYLSEALNLPVELGNPLLKLSSNSSGFPDELLGAIAPRLGIAVGLALDEVQ
jgi:type IV pilus assembly protein PilM